MNKIVIIILIIFLSVNISAEEDKVISSVPIQSDYGYKVVYTTDSMADIKMLQEDCNRRKGVLSPCGSVCDDRGDNACFSVCAFTCELGEKFKNSEVKAKYEEYIKEEMKGQKFIREQMEQLKRNKKETKIK